ncbi:MAG TPA: hypothetical protein VMX14_12615 [Anaerolineae bacterium]|nr:hypothetical protein [Anaerolineae bacterium]
MLVEDDLLEALGSRLYPLPIQTEAIGLEKVVALLPSGEGSLDRLGDALQAKDQKGSHVLGFLVELALEHQMTQDLCDGASQLIPSLAWAGHVDDSGHVSLSDGIG